MDRPDFDGLDDFQNFFDGDASHFFDQTIFDGPLSPGLSNLGLDLFPSETPTDQGYGSSSNCSETESGKLSPSGSDSTSDNGSPWVYPSPQEPTTAVGSPQSFQEARNVYVDQRMDGNIQTWQEEPIPCTSYYRNEYYESHPPLQPRTSNPLPPSAAPPKHYDAAPTPRKLLYIVPSPQATSVPQSPICTPVPLVKQNPAPVVLGRNGVPLQLQPISVLGGHQMAQRKLSLHVDPREDEYQRKRDDRRYKNRVAAQVSRTKKKEETEKLKEEMSRLMDENERLRHENSELKRRLAVYEGRPTAQSSNGPPSRKRAAVASGLFLAVFVFASFQPFSLQNDPVLPQSAHVSLPKTIENRHSRVLRDSENQNITSLPTSSTLNGTVLCLNSNLKKGYYNKTESMRIMTDLYEWVDRHEQMSLHMKGGKRVLLQKRQKEWIASNKEKRVQLSGESVDQKRAGRKKETPRQKAQRSWKHLDMIGRYQDSLGTKVNDQNRDFLPTKEDFERLASSIQQRSDTLYVVPLKDYFLLPAVERNLTSRPRLTIILPALSGNATASELVPLMRIDLDVVGTGLFYLSRKLLPLLN